MGELNTTKATILVVEDDSFSQAILNMFLSSSYCTIIAENGLEALTLLQNGLQPQLIISDLNTPKMNGYQLLEFLKASTTYQTIPFIVLCGDDGEEQEIQCLQAGAAAFIVKPFNPTALALLIKNLLITSS
jgi:CheY-like chemotaxis protein